MAALVVAPPGLLELRFFNLGSPELASVQAQAFLFEGGEVRMLPAGERVGHHAGNHWRVGTGRYLRLEIPQLVKCRLEGGDTEEEHGPFARLEAVDALMLADARPFALLKARHWQLLSTQRRWLRMRVTAAR